MADHVIDVHRHTVNADRVVDAQIDGQTHFRAHPISTRHQDRISIVASEQSLVEVEAEHARESAVRTNHSGAMGGPNRLGKPLDRGITSFDIHPRIGICQSTRSHVGEFYRVVPHSERRELWVQRTKHQAPRLH